MISFSVATRRLPIACFALASLVAACGAPPETATVTYVVTADQAGASVSVVDADSARVVRTLATEVGPHEAIASGDGRWIAVSNYGDGQTEGGSLLVVDAHSLRVTDTISLGRYRRPHGMAFLPGDSLLAVTVERDSAVLIVRFPSGDVKTALPTGQWVSHLLALHPDGRRVYTANIVDATVSEMDIAGDSLVRTAPVGPAAEAIGITPDGRELWVGSNSEHTITVLGTEDLAPITTLDAPGFPYRIVFTPDGSTAVVTQPEAGLVRLFDVAKHRESGTITVSGEPAGIALSADGSLAYVTRNAVDSIAVLSLVDRTVLRMLPAGPTPDGIVVLEGHAALGEMKQRTGGRRLQEMSITGPPSTSMRGAIPRPGASDEASRPPLRRGAPSAVETVT
jgi:DNA-binding beta-propeller fold protein YncE